jgi:acyl-CoA thioester hydrolase
MAASFPVVHELHPRFRDTDAMGHINNAVYITYLEVARQEYWQRLRGLVDYGRVPFILARVECDFRSEALMREVLLLHIRCPRIGTKSFTFEYEIREQASSRLVVEATSVQVCYDYEAKRSIPVPGLLREAFERLEGRSFNQEG